MIGKIITLITYLLVQSAKGQEFVSPCPDLFSYLPSEATADSWNGEIRLKTEAELSGIYLRLTFDQPPLEVLSEFGEVLQRESKDFLIKKPNYKLSPGTIENVKITVKFTSGQPVPKLTGIKLNAVSICTPAAAAVTASNSQSPCPDQFMYEPPGTETDTWNGVITLTSESELAGIYNRIIFDRQPLEVTSDFGDVVQREATAFLIRKPQHKLSPGQSLKIRLAVKFNPAEPVPRIVGLHLNAKSICPGAPPKPTTPAPLAKGLISPCPNVFMYESLDQQLGKWHGVIFIKTDTTLSDFVITLLLDRPSLQLGEWTGDISTYDNIEYKLKKSGLVLQPGVRQIKFFIKYKVSRPIPKLAGIMLNEKNICDEDAGLPFTQESIQSVVQPTSENSVIEWLTGPKPGGNTDDEFFSADFNHFAKPSPGISLGNEAECGTVTVQATPFITHGQATIAGQWPWHAALYQNQKTDLKYICGASLVSKTFALTVGHCVTRQQSNSPLDPEQLVVVLGKYYLTKWGTPGIQDVQVNTIMVHPDYDNRNYKNDIALLKLDRQVDYTDTVRPVCLWSESTDLNAVVNKQGSVVGWGFDHMGRLSDKLTGAKMPVVAADTCIYSYPEFFGKFTNTMTLCAGFLNGTSVCNGDSGGGMVFPKRDLVSGKPIWQIRGLVSVGVSLKNLDTCDPSHYVVFTDVAKYLNWIKQSMLK